MSLSPRFHSLRVADVKHEGHDAVSIAFIVPPELGDAYRFAPGQYLTLRRNFDGEEVRRSYSICVGPEDAELRIAIKRVDQGVFSSWINSDLHVGDSLDVMTPTGRFGLESSPGNGRVHVAFAAGSGITPILSILRAVLAREPDSRFFLFFGNRSTNEILFRSALEELKDRYLGRLSVFHVLSREQQDLPILNGHLDGAKARALLTGMIGVALVDHVFICGPTAMIDDLEATLPQIGVPAEMIHTERFVSAFSGRPRPTAPAVVTTAPPTHVATLIIDGKRRDIGVADGEAILDAALRAGMDLPFACKGGMCSTCRARLVEGEARMEVNYSLEPWELQAGYVLTCQSHMISDRVVIDFDQV
jgi:ring-1,2-phenylacetyl-CoA epoxidase subunit PaaE